MDKGEWGRRTGGRQFLEYTNGTLYLFFFTLLCRSTLLHSSCASSSISLSIHPIIPPLHPCCCQDIPCDHLITPPPLLNSTSSLLLSTLPRSLPFFIKPLTLCGKWAHSPIQCLLRHDGRDFYIKTDKAGLGFRSAASQWGQTPRRLTVGWIGGRNTAAECRDCASRTELKFGRSRTSRCSRQRWWRRKMRCCRCLRFARP